MFKFHGKDPQGFFFYSFISSPLDEVLQFAFVSLVELGVEDLEILYLGLPSTLAGGGGGWMW